MKRFLLIGAGIGQINIARKIKRKGHYLIVIAYNSLNEVTTIADKFIQHDLFDYEGVLSIAKSEGVEAVISDQHDIMAPLVAYIAEALGLPGNKYKTVMSYCNKNTFRENCDKLSIPSPRHTKVLKAEIPSNFANTPFPWIVKPADSQSSVGVTKVNTKEECIKAIEYALSCSRSHSAIIEEFFLGKELVAEGFIWRGHYYNIGFADRKYFDLENLFIPSQTIFPSTVNNKILSQINDYEKRMSEYTNPDFAIVHSEYLYNEKSGEIRIVESGLRGGGVFISSHLIPYYSGIDINDMLIEAVEGKELDMQSILNRKEEHAAAYICFYLHEGVITDIDGISEIEKMNSVIMSNIKDLQIGSRTSAMTHKGMRLGPILIHSQNLDCLQKEISKVQDTLNILVQDNNSYYKINWE